MVREAVSNTVRHAHATALRITVTTGVCGLVIDVTDDGVGIPSAVAQSGLHNLRTRAAALDGTFSVAARPEGGTRLVWMAPLRGPSREPLDSDGLDRTEGSDLPEPESVG